MSAVALTLLGGVLYFACMYSPILVALLQRRASRISVEREKRRKDAHIMRHSHVVFLTKEDLWPEAQERESA